jgi:6-pyruvoyltetrahydropterin/6-carboxytetrahydropterin synthase
MELRTSVVIAMAHRLMDHPGKCKNIHGHNWTINCVIGIDPVDAGSMERGFVVESSALRKSIQDVTSGFDHTTILQEGDPAISALLNLGSNVIVINKPPSTENLASLFYDVIKEQLNIHFPDQAPLNYLELTETPNYTVYAMGYSTGVKLV